jgi:hypothetical protein
MLLLAKQSAVEAQMNISQKEKGPPRLRQAFDDEGFHP